MYLNGHTNGNVDQAERYQQTDTNNIGNIYDISKI